MDDLLKLWEAESGNLGGQLLRDMRNGRTVHLAFPPSPPPIIRDATEFSAELEIHTAEYRMLETDRNFALLGRRRRDDPWMLLTEFAF